MMPMMLLSPERKGKENMHSMKPQRQQPFFSFQIGTCGYSKKGRQWLMARRSHS